MKYAFLTLIAVYLITFFGCTPDEPHKVQDNKTVSTEKHQVSPEQKPEPSLDTAQTDGKWESIADSATENVLEIIAEEQEEQPAAPERVEQIEEIVVVEPEHAEQIAIVQAEEIPLPTTATVSQPAAAKDEALSDAVVQMETASRELLQLTGALILENRQLKAALKNILQATTEPDAAEESTPARATDSAPQQEPSASEQLGKAIDNVKDAAQQLSDKAADKAGEVIAEKSDAAKLEAARLAEKVDTVIDTTKEMAKDLTRKTVDAASSALDSAKTTVEKTGESIMEKLAPAEKTAPTE